MLPCMGADSKQTVAGQDGVIPQPAVNVRCQQALCYVLYNRAPVTVLALWTGMVEIAG